MNPKGWFCCFPISESRTEGGRRQESEGTRAVWVDDAVCRKVLAVSLAYGGSGNGKFVHQEQPGESTLAEPHYLPDHPRGGG